MSQKKPFRTKLSLNFKPLLRAQIPAYQNGSANFLGITLAPKITLLKPKSSINVKEWGIT